MTKKCYKTDDVERLAMANCAMILHRAESRSFEPGRIFKCKTCHRSFATFQALGGHTASHKRPKLGDGHTKIEKQLIMKAHMCSICKEECWTGRALGGHMRDHRAAKISHLGTNESNNSSSITSSDGHSDYLKMVNYCDDERILGLDLNLSPEENGFKIFEF